MVCPDYQIYHARYVLIILTPFTRIFSFQPKKVKQSSKADTKITSNTTKTKQRKKDTQAPEKSERSSTSSQKALAAAKLPDSLSAEEVRAAGDGASEGEL